MRPPMPPEPSRSEEHTSELQSHSDLVCRLLLEKKKNNVNLVRVHRREQVAKSRRRVRLDQLVLVRRCDHRFHGRELEPDRVAFFFNDTATTEIYTLSLHDALPI